METVPTWTCCALVLVVCLCAMWKSSSLIKSLIEYRIPTRAINFPNIRHHLERYWTKNLGHLRRNPKHFEWNFVNWLCSSLHRLQLCSTRLYGFIHRYPITSHSTTKLSSLLHSLSISLSAGSIIRSKLCSLMFIRKTYNFLVCK